MLIIVKDKVQISVALSKRSRKNRRRGAKCTCKFLCERQTYEAHLPRVRFAGSLLSS